MQTPWGELPVSDAHVHFFSHHFFATLGKQKGDLGAEDVIRIAGCEPPPADPVLLGRRWVEELDQATVASAVLIASVPGDEDSVAAAVSKFPDRLYGYFLLNPLALDVADRIEAASVYFPRCTPTPFMTIGSGRYSMPPRHTRVRSCSFIAACSASGYARSLGSPLRSTCDTRIPPTCMASRCDIQRFPS